MYCGQVFLGNHGNSRNIIKKTMQSFWTAEKLVVNCHVSTVLQGSIATVTFSILTLTFGLLMTRLYH